MADTSPGEPPDRSPLPVSPGIAGSPPDGAGPSAGIAGPSPDGARLPDGAQLSPDSPPLSSDGSALLPDNPPQVSAPDGAAAVRMSRLGRSWRRGLVMAATILVIAGSAIYMLLELGESLGLQALVIGLVAAIVPVPVLVACFLWLDRYEPEPMKYLVGCFAWGAFVSTAASLNVNRAAAELFHGWGLPDSLVAVFVAPFIEELTKALFPILLLLFRRREWSGITDGIVYCGLSAVGFAMVENILYLGGHGYAAGVEQYGPATGVQMVFLIFILRVLLTGFAHPLFTSMTGVGLGIAARSADRRVRVLTPLAGLLLAMMLHGTWNLMPSLAVATGQSMILLYGYISVMMPIFFGMVGLAIWLRSWEGRLTERRLPDYVRAGWLTPPEVASLGSLGRRHSARRWARRVAGDQGLRAMRGYQFAATRLALLRDGMLRGLDTRQSGRARSIDEERELLEAISAFRRVFSGRDPQTPAGIWDGTHYHLAFPDGVRRVVPAPDEPVVPIPVVLAPAAPPAGFTPHRPPAPGGNPYSGHPAPPVPPTFGPYPGHQPQPGHGHQPQPGHGHQPQPGQGYQPQPGHGGHPGYGHPGHTPPGHGAHPGYPPPDYGPPAGSAGWHHR